MELRSVNFWKLNPVVQKYRVQIQPKYMWNCRILLESILKNLRTVESALCGQSGLAVVSHGSRSVKHDKFGADNFTSYLNEKCLHKLQE